MNKKFEAILYSNDVHAGILALIILSIVYKLYTLNISFIGKYRIAKFMEYYIVFMIVGVIFTLLFVIFQIILEVGVIDA